MKENDKPMNAYEAWRRTASERYGLPELSGGFKVIQVSQPNPKGEIMKDQEPDDPFMAWLKENIKDDGVRIVTLGSSVISHRFSQTEPEPTDEELEQAAARLRKMLGSRIDHVSDAELKELVKADWQDSQTTKG